MKGIRDKFILYSNFNFDEEYSELDLKTKNVKIYKIIAPQPLNGPRGIPVKCLKLIQVIH